MTNRRPYNPAIEKPVLSSKAQSRPPELNRDYHENLLKQLGVSGTTSLGSSVDRLLEYGTVNGTP